MTCALCEEISLQAPFRSACRCKVWPQLQLDVQVLCRRQSACSSYIFKTKCLHGYLQYNKFSLGLHQLSVDQISFAKVSRHSLRVRKHSRNSKSSRSLLTRRCLLNQRQLTEQSYRELNDRLGKAAVRRKRYRKEPLKLFPY